MSADNGIFYRQIGSSWYVMHGFASDEYLDADYVQNGKQFDSESECVTAAAEMSKERDILEYGIVNDNT